MKLNIYFFSGKIKGFICLYKGFYKEDLNILESEEITCGYIEHLLYKRTQLNQYN